MIARLIAEMGQRAADTGGARFPRSLELDKKPTKHVIGQMTLGCLGWDLNVSKKARFILCHIYA